MDDDEPSQVKEVASSEDWGKDAWILLAAIIVIFFLLFDISNKER
jgi:hypothetical protein